MPSSGEPSCAENANPCHGKSNWRESSDVTVKTSRGWHRWPTPQRHWTWRHMTVGEYQRRRERLLRLLWSSAQVSHLWRNTLTNPVSSALVTHTSESSMCPLCALHTTSLHPSCPSDALLLSPPYFHLCCLSSPVSSTDLSSPAILLLFVSLLPFPLFLYLYVSLFFFFYWFHQAATLQSFPFCFLSFLANLSFHLSLNLFLNHLCIILFPSSPILSPCLLYFPLFLISPPALASVIPAGICILRSV